MTTASHRLLLGVDGGGSHCRARLCRASGEILGEGRAGPGTLSFGVDEAFSAIFEAAAASLTMAGLNPRAFGEVCACLALAGATEPSNLAAARRHPHPFGKAFITTDVHAACVGAHAGRDGGVVVIGTGIVGWAELSGRQYRVGGWGFPLSDEGSGAWLGFEALRRVLWADDKRIAWSELLTALFERFDGDPHAIVRFKSRARPKDYAAFAPLVVDHARRGDEIAGALMGEAAAHVEALLARLVAFGAQRLSIVGGLAQSIAPFLSGAMRDRLTPPLGDALDGAVALARATADTPAVAGG